MADVNVNAPAGQAPTMAPPTRTDDQILPHTRWVPIGKINCYLDVEKSQSNLIYKITLDEQWFDLTKDTPEDAFQITPFNNNQAFTSPPSSDALINFVNELGYLKLTSGFERPRAPMLQILWGIVTRAHIDYAERIWEEFTQSIHTFIEDKRNLAQHTYKKKKATLIVIPNIQGASYYHEYLAKVAKHERYLAGETGSDPDSPAPKPTKVVKKPKATAPKVDLRPPVSKPVLSKQPKPKSAPAKTQGKKRKLTTKISDKPSKAIKSRPGLVSKKRKHINTLRSVDELVDADVPEKEPQVDNEEADVHRALEESLKSMHDVPWGPLPPVVIREPESEKYQLLLEVPRKGKEKLGLTDSEEESEEDVPGADAGGQGKGQAGPDPGAQDEGQAGSNLDEQAEGQAGPDPGNAEASQPMPSPVVHAGSDCEHMDLDVQENLKLTVEEQVLLEEPASLSGTLSSLKHLTKDLSFGDLFFNDKPSEADNDKATAETEAESMVCVTIQQDMSSIPPMTTPIIDLTSRPESPKVHQLLKATTTETITTTTIIILSLASQQQQSTTDAMMMKRIGELEHIMANLIQENKRLGQRLDSHGARLYTLEQLDIPYSVSKAVDKLVTDAVDWAMQALLRNRFKDLPEADMKEILHQRMWETDSYKSHEDHMQLYEAIEKSMNRDHSEELVKDLAEARKKKKKSRESPKTPHGPPPHQPPPPPPPAELAKDLAEARKKKKKSRESPKTPHGSPPHQPPPPPPPAGQSKGSATPSSSKTTVSAKYQAWTTTDIRLRPSISLTPADLQIDDDMSPDEQAQSSDDKDIENAHILKAGDITMFMDWFCKRQGITELKLQDLEGLAFEIIKVFHPNVIHLQYQMEECHKLLTDSVDDSILKHNVSKPLPLGGPPDQVTIQSDFFFNKDLEYLSYDSKGSRPALSISKMKEAYYPDAGLEQIMPDQMWIEEECKYDIVAMYGISHWWFQRQRFYIDRHTSEGVRRAVRTYMRILSVVRIEVFSMYGYNYMKKIVLRRVNLNEHVITERDFKYLYPSDFEDLYLLNLQGHLNHLPPKDKKILTTTINLWTRHLVIRQRVENFQLGIESYQTQLNLTKPRWDATGFEYKHDYTIIDSLRAVTFRDRYGVQMIMCFNEIHKFSDGMLQRIDESLDYRVKEFKINRMNPGLNTRFRTRKDVDRKHLMLSNEDVKTNIAMVVEMMKLALSWLETDPTRRHSMSSLLRSWISKLVVNIES
nr:hypothetical protein [Tanacetum cinerariifolium]